MKRPRGSDEAVRYGSRYAPSEDGLGAHTCPMCDAVLSNTRATFCSVACKQRAFRMRHQQSAIPDEVMLRQQLKRQRVLAMHTVYECPGCGERFVGERRCPSCQLFCRALGVGGRCPACDDPILLSDLLDVEVTSAQ